MGSFRVVTTGLREGVDRDAAERRLTDLFQRTPAEIRPLLLPKRNVVKRRLDAEQAAKYRKSLIRCGCDAAIEEEPEFVPVFNEEQLADIYPDLRRQPDIFSEGPSAEVMVSLVGDLAMAFRFGDSRVVITNAMLAKSGMTREQLSVRACTNLYALIKPRLLIRRKRTATAKGRVIWKGRKSFNCLEAGEQFEAACLFLPPVWKALKTKVRGPLRIAIPTTGTCYYCGADDTSTYLAMREIARQARDAAASHALSDYIYTLNEQGQLKVVERYPIASELPLPEDEPDLVGGEVRDGAARTRRYMKIAKAVGGAVLILVLLKIGFKMA